MKTKQKLEEIVKNNIIKESLAQFTKHPIILGTIVLLSSLAIAESNILPQLIKKQSHLGYGYLSYLGFSMIDKYYINNKSPFRIEYANLLDKFDDAIRPSQKFEKWFYQNKEIVGFVNWILFIESLRSLYSSKPGVPPGVIDAAVFSGAITELAIVANNRMAEIKKANPQEQYSTIKKIWNLPYNFPLLVAIPIAAYHFNNIFPKIQHINPESTLSPIVLSFFPAVVLGLLGYSSAIVAGSVLHTDSLKRFSLKIKNKLAPSLEEILLIQDPQQKAVAYSELASLKHNQGKIEDAIKYYRRAIKTYKSEQTANTHLGLITSGLKIQKIRDSFATLRYKLKKNPTLVETISQINRYYLADKNEKSLELCKILVNNSSNDLLVLSYSASLLDSLGYDSSGIWLNLIKSAGDFKENCFDSSSRQDNKVFTIKHSVLEDCIVLKTGSKEKLKDEFEKTKEVYRIYQDEVKVTHPILMLEEEDKFIIVMSHANGVPIQKNEDPFVIEGLIKSIAEYHIKLKHNLAIHLDSIDYNFEILRSVDKLGLNKKLYEKHIQEYLSETTALPNNFVIHNDLHPGNTLYISETKSICIIDPQTLCRGPVNIDLSSALDNSTVNLPFDYREKHWRDYFYYNPTRKSYEEFRQDQVFASLHKNLRMAGITSFRSLTPEKEESEKNTNSTLFYLRNVKNYSNQLANKKIKDFINCLLDDLAFQHQ